MDNGQTKTVGLWTLLVFTDPNCVPCSTLMPDLARWQDEYDDVLSVVSVSRKSAAENRDKAEEHGLRTVLLQTDFETAEAYGAAGTPSAVIVHPTGVIGSPVATGTDLVRGLVQRGRSRSRATV